MKRIVLVSAVLAVSSVVLPMIAVVTAVGAFTRFPSQPRPSADASDIPPDVLGDYQAAAATCPGLSWTVLAGIGKVESDHGRSRLPGVHDGANSAGAEGPMQVLPATFAAYAVGPHPSPYDMADATTAAARLLCANGAADPSRLRQAIWDYNHSWSYVDTVLAWSDRYAARPEGRGQVAAAWALQQVGIPYRWGATGPDAYDCSGLVMRAWQVAGVMLPRVAADQYRAGTHVLMPEAVAGDLVFYASDPADPSTIEHVAMYLGGGMMVEAPHAGANVRVVPVYPEGLVVELTRP